MCILVYYRSTMFTLFLNEVLRSTKVEMLGQSTITIPFTPRPSVPKAAAAQKAHLWAPELLHSLSPRLVGFWTRDLPQLTGWWSRIYLSISMVVVDMRSQYFRLSEAGGLWVQGQPVQPELCSTTLSKIIKERKERKKSCKKKKNF